MFASCLRLRSTAPAAPTHPPPAAAPGRSVARHGAHDGTASRGGRVGRRGRHAASEHREGGTEREPSRARGRERDASEVGRHGPKSEHGDSGRERVATGKPCPPPPRGHIVALDSAAAGLGVPSAAKLAGTVAAQRSALAALALDFALPGADGPAALPLRSAARARCESWLRHLDPMLPTLAAEAVATRERRRWDFEVRRVRAAVLLARQGMATRYGAEIVLSMLPERTAGCRGGPLG